MAGVDLTQKGDFFILLGARNLLGEGCSALFVKGLVGGTVFFLFK